MVVVVMAVIEHLTVSCLLLVTTTVVTTMVVIVVFCTKTNNYDQLLVNKPPTNQQTRNCHLLSLASKHVRSVGLGLELVRRATIRVVAHAVTALPVAILANTQIYNNKINNKNHHNNNDNKNVNHIVLVHSAKTIQQHKFQQLLDAAASK